MTTSLPPQVRCAERRTSGAYLGYHRLRGANRPVVARERTVESSLSFDELQRELHHRVFRFVMRLRLVIAPFPIMVGVIVVVLDHALWRRVAMGTALPLVAILSVMEDARVKREGVPRMTRVALVAGAAFQPVVLLASGGVLSPIILAMLLVAFVASVLLEKRASQLLLFVQIAILVGATALEYTQWFGTLIPEPFRGANGWTPSHMFLLVWVTIATVVFVVAHEMGTRIQGAFADLLRHAMWARDESLRLYKDQFAELSTLSGEIAHELKNPLASVKGLAALLSRRHFEQEPEPLTVLRREIDRMQGILDEFLNYSRPLVPLNLKLVDLSAIAGEVCAMHEGISETREIHLRFEAPGPIEVRCDPRKVQQILVNLFQNALEASTAGSSVWVRVFDQGKLAEICVDDQGPGLDPALCQRVFEAGVTNKPGGSGLGLNLARGLARQHGGEVLLRDRAEGGCRACLTLPREPEVGQEAGTPQ